MAGWFPRDDDAHPYHALNAGISSMALDTGFSADVQLPAVIGMVAGIGDWDRFANSNGCTLHGLSAPLTRPRRRPKAGRLVLVAALEGPRGTG